ncbi:alpha-1A adrenergic receptor-like [Bolinopsis microptera]|uniref:alpha-1A adrenergic receptor-like n=1 Tax=Bolinopsis microptera TaxID=2820187 RepID=UPI003078ADA6
MTNPAGMAGEAERIALGLSMSVFAVVAVLGNVLFWFALLCDKRALGISNAFLVNLSVSDFVVGLWNMPITVISVAANKWPLGNALCNFSAFVDNTMLLISVWTVACSSLDKFYMIQYPLHYNRNITWTRVTKLIVCIWVTAGLCNSPPLFNYQGLKFGYSKLSYSCGLVCPSELYGQALVKALESSSQCRSFMANSINLVEIKRVASTETLRCKSDVDRFRTDLQLPRSASLSSRIVKRNGSAVSVVLKRSVSSLVPGHVGGSGPASDSMLIRKRHNKSNTVTVLVIIGVMMSCFLPVTFVGFIHFIDGSLIQVGPEFFIAFHWLLLSNSAVNPVFAD